MRTSIITCDRCSQTIGEFHNTFFFYADGIIVEANIPGEKDVCQKCVVAIVAQGKEMKLPEARKVAEWAKEQRK